MKSQNLKAFLHMIAVSEGTAHIGDNGYNVLVGSTAKNPILFASYADHPRRKIYISVFKLWSTAAGRYQILQRYFDHYKKTLNLKDFSPASQDAIAIQQIRERRALADVEAGRFDQAVFKVRRIWASLPGAGYGQHENKIERLRAVYIEAGGEIAA